MATAKDFTIRLPGVTRNMTNESPLAALLRQRSYLDPMSQAMWDADPRNQAEITRLRREEALLPPESIPGSGVNLIPNTPPPGGWTPTNTYNDIFGKPAATPPAAVAPQRPGTVPGSVWNNPDSAAPAGYNPELWAQREIGPNRTTAGTLGGPRNADGTAMYAPPPEYKPTRGIDPFGYEPAPRKQTEFSGFTIGDDGFYRSDRGGSGVAYDENLLTTLKAAADAGDGRANHILSSLSTGADMTRPVFSAKMNQYGANPIDNYAAQYDWEQEVLEKKEMQRKLKQGWTIGENRQLVPPGGWIEDGNGGWRPPLDDSSWTQVGNGSRWVRTENTSTEPKVPDMGKPDKESANPFMNWKANIGKPVSRYPNGTMNRNPFSAAFMNPMPNPQRRVVPVGRVPMQPGQVAAPPPMRPMPMPPPVYAPSPPITMMPTNPNFPMPTERPRMRMPAPLQRMPVWIGQPHVSEVRNGPVGVPIPPRPYVDNSRPNPFLMGGANRVNGNPFRR